MSCLLNDFLSQHFSLTPLCRLVIKFNYACYVWQSGLPCSFVGSWQKGNELYNSVINIKRTLTPICRKIELKTSGEGKEKALKRFVLGQHEVIQVV